jgi:hypothetical protein
MWGNTVAIHSALKKKTIKLNSQPTQYQKKNQQTQFLKKKQQKKKMKRRRRQF